MSMLYLSCRHPPHPVHEGAVFEGCPLCSCCWSEDATPQLCHPRWIFRIRWKRRKTPPNSTAGTKETSNPSSATSHFPMEHQDKILSKCINATANILNLMKDWSQQYGLNWQNTWSSWHYLQHLWITLNTQKTHTQIKKCLQLQKNSFWSYPAASCAAKKSAQQPGWCWEKIPEGEGLAVALKHWVSSFPTSRHPSLHCRLLSQSSLKVRSSSMKIFQ